MALSCGALLCTQHMRLLAVKTTLSSSNCTHITTHSTVHIATDCTAHALVSFLAVSCSALGRVHVSLGKGGHMTKIREILPKGFNPDLYTTEQVFYECKDGTKIPVHILANNN